MAPWVVRENGDHFSGMERAYTAFCSRSSAADKGQRPCPGDVSVRRRRNQVGDVAGVAPDSELTGLHAAWCVRETFDRNSGTISSPPLSSFIWPLLPAVVVVPQIADGVALARPLAHTPTRLQRVVFARAEKFATIIPSGPTCSIRRVEKCRCV